MDFKFEPEDVVKEKRVTQEGIDSIKTWLSKNTDLPQIPEQMIVLFLLSCDNSIEFTQKTIMSYYKCKKNSPEIFDDRDITRDDLKNALQTIALASIPQRTPKNDVIHYFKIVNTKYYKFDLVPCMKLSYMILDISQEINPPDGLIVVMDMAGFGLMHMTRLKLGALKKYIQFLQEGFPIKLKKIHILNTVYFMDKILNILKAFMKAEIFQLMEMHPSNMKMEDFFEKYVPQNCMPLEYGGTQPCYADLHVKTIEQLQNRQTYFDAEEKMRKLVD